jgi:radical SAM superfamily enzyme YgiQ (UPF0313 family)
MAEVLLGQSYFLRFDPKLWEAMQPYPPLGTLYAASYLRQRGYQVALFDAMLADSEQQWAEALEQHQPRYAILYEDNFNYLSKMCLLRMREAAFTMARMAKDRGCTVIAGGADATDHAEAYLNHGVDLVLLGEGEVTLGELMDCLTGRNDLTVEEIHGLAYRRVKKGIDAGSQGHRIAGADEQMSESGNGRNGEPCGRTAPRPILRDLDSLPFPAWDLVDMSRYRNIWTSRHGYTSLNMVTTRGCPYHCNWCAKPIWGQRYHSRSPENVVAELRCLQETYHPDHISFVDDIMGLKPGWLDQFAREIERYSVQAPFKCLSRVDLLLRDGDIKALARAGAHTVWVGAESGSQKILDAMEKGTTVEQIYEASRGLHEAGIRVAFFLQFGYPGETREDIEKTLQMVRDCRPDDIGMSVSYPLPGTTFHERVRDELSVKQNWQDSSDLAMLYHGPYNTEFYRQLHRVLHKEYRARRTWWRWSNPGQQDGKPSLRETAAAAYHLVTLPAARGRLRQLERAVHQGMGPLAPGLSHQAAATPSPQPDQ